MNSAQHPPVTLLRRLGGIFYDTLLVISVIFLVHVVTYMTLRATGVGEIHPDSDLSHAIFVFYILVALIYFVGFWTHGGQTPAMKIWKMRVENRQGGQINHLDAIARFGFALLLPVVSQLWSLFDKDRLALHDRLSHTRLVYIG